MGCLGCEDQPNDKNDEEPGPTKPSERGCTDVLCCCLMLLYWVGMLGIFGLALTFGNPYSVVYGKDYGGFRCGIPGEGVPDPTLSKIYYPQLSADLARQSDLIETPWKLHLYGLCVETCPQQGEVVTDYGCSRPTLYPQASKSKCTNSRGQWVTPLNTQNVLNRCMPVTSIEGNKTLLCSMPNCLQAKRPCYKAQYAERNFWQLNPTDTGAMSQCVTQVQIGTTLQYDAAGAGPAEAKLAQSMTGLNQVVFAIMESKIAIAVFGIAAPLVLGFFFIFLMRWAAGPIVYLGIFVLMITMFAATLLCAFKAEFFGGYLSEMLAAQGNSTYVLSATDQYRDLYDSVTSHAAVQTVSSYAEFIQPTAICKGGLDSCGREFDTQIYKIATLALMVLDFGYLAFICLFSHQISIAVAIIEESSSVIAHQPTSLFYPFVTIGALVVLSAYTVVGGVFIGTLNNDAIESAFGNFTDELSGFNDEYGEGQFNLTALNGLDPDQTTHVKMALMGYHVFGFLWAVNFLLAGSTMVIAGSVSFWFFYRNNTDEYPTLPVLSSMHMVVRYHLGTIAFGSLCLALVQALRAILEYINYKTAEAQEGNFLLKMSMCCVRCCMWCFEKCIKFVSGYAYIYVALNGDSFCSACKATFTLFLSYPAQVSVNAFVQTLLRVLQCVALPVGCAVGCYYYADKLDGSPNALVPSFFSLILSYAVCRVFSGVYETTVDTIFVCAMRDKDKFDGRHTPEGLAEVLGIN
mmetsp:Transcript_17306/g.44323  ORF Transcript_17306/g.44323 Transcript_17306/m.44323 type:complete len:745 (-) Transcript_17306:187-2421(-)